MRTVRGPDGDRYRLVEAAADAALLEDPETGERRRVPIEDLDRLTDDDRGRPTNGGRDRSTSDSPLEAKASALPDPVSTLVTGVHDERSLGLLLWLDEAGPTSVPTVTKWTDDCESDLHGRLAELVCADLLAETTVHGRRGYETTPAASTALKRLTD